MSEVVSISHEALFLGVVHEPLNRQFFKRAQAQLTPLIEVAEGVRPVFFLEAIGQSQSEAEERRKLIADGDYQDIFVRGTFFLDNKRMPSKMETRDFKRLLAGASLEDFLKLGWESGDEFFAYQRASMVQNLRTPSTVILFEGSSDRALRDIKKLEVEAERATENVQTNLSFKRFSQAVDENKGRLSDWFSIDQIRDPENAKFLIEFLVSLSNESPVLLIPIFGVSHHPMADHLVQKGEGLTQLRVSKDLGHYANSVQSQIDASLQNGQQVSDVLSARDMFAYRASEVCINRLITLGRGDMILDRYEDIHSFIDSRTMTLSLERIEELLLGRDSDRAILKEISPLTLPRLNNA